MTELYINNQKVDLIDDISILLTKTKSDYTNPTVVKNSFSKTITLPGTTDNNSLFNEIWSLDRTHWTGAFNPSKRVEFKLITDGTLVEIGYIKLNKIRRSAGTYEYEITLFGELGNILYSLSYDIDENDEVHDLTLGNLIYENELTFNINKNMILNGWNTLKGTDTSHPIYQTINFMPAYNGKPKANNFDAKKVWVAEYNPIEAGTMWNNGLTRWDGTTQSGMPKSRVVDEVEYKLLDTHISQMDPDEYYGLIDLPDDVTDVEIRDFRSYLLRPILRLKSIFEAIDRYIYQKDGWHLVLDDPFFSLPDYTDAWVTLNMLYEINPDVETNTRFTQSQLLSKTAAPFKYLVSFCKMYGLYLDVDVTAKTLALKSMKNFFNDKTEPLVVNEMVNITIDPLSFDKSSYTFDFAESKDADFIKKYNETHEAPYGSKKVNTGYQFDNSTDKYIKENIFKNATDAIEQSPYYKCSKDYPAALFDYEAVVNSGVQYTLFADGMADSAESDRYSANINRNNDLIPSIGLGLYYITQNPNWGGLKPNIWQDDIIKVQLHNDSNESVDGSNMIVYFQGMKSSTAVTPTYVNSTKKTIWQDVPSVTSDIYWNVSDDSDVLKRAIGKNCWVNNISPQDGYGYSSPVSVVKEIPQFTRENYDYSDNYKLFKDKNFDTFAIQNVNGCITNVGQSVNRHHIKATNEEASPNITQVYFTHPLSLISGHKYVVLASVKSDQNPNYLHTPYAGVDGGVSVIDHMDISTSNQYVITGSIVKTGHVSGTYQIFPFKMGSKASRIYNIDTRWIAVYDLTDLGVDNIDTVAAAINYFKVPMLEQTSFGIPYTLTDSHDFSTPTEIYIPSASAKLNNDIYSQFWKDYIADLYSIDTRIIDAEIILDNIHDSFKKFYWYENSLWILSSVTDWNPDTKLCKAKLLKVNDRGNYTDYLDITPGMVTVGYNGSAFTLRFKKYGGSSTYVSWYASSNWITDQYDDTIGVFDLDSTATVTFTAATNNTNNERNATLTFEWEGNTYIIPIKQDGLFVANVVVTGGVCDYTLSSTTFSPGRVLTLTMTPGEHEHIVSVFANKEDVTNSIRNSSLFYTTKNENVTFYINVDPDPVIGVDVVVENKAGGYPFLKDKEGNYIVDQTFAGEDIRIDFRTNEHFKVSEFIVNGVNLTNRIVNDKYTLTNVSGNQSIRITYEYIGVWFEIVATPDDAQIAIVGQINI